ncbi:MAG: DinB family protein [Leptospira sp.]|nr:DinB family protein [Leptospira sp.]
MNDRDQIVSCLESSPIILRNLIKSVPESILKVKRIRNKWSAHEHACHLAEAQPMMISRFKRFRDEENITIQPYIPGKTTPAGELMEKNLEDSLNMFATLRTQLLSLIRNLDSSIWVKKISHPEYIEYNPYIFLRHILMHDYVHMYRIEELWLTTDEYLPM